MSDAYIDIILGSLAKTDTGRITASTGRLSTLYSGERTQVLDAWKACFVHAYTKGVHMTAESTFFTSPGGSASQDDYLPNAAVSDEHFMCSAKIAVYTESGWNEAHTYVRRTAEENHVLRNDEYDCVVLSGDIQSVFRTVEEVTLYAAEQTGRCTVTVTLSVNSPTAE